MATGDSTIGSDERRFLLAPNFQPVAFGDGGQQQRDTPQAVATTVDPLSSLPVDTLTNCLAHLSALDIDALRLTSKTSLANCTTSPVWKVLCIRTGKLLPHDVVPCITSSSQIEDKVSNLPSSQSTRFFDRYRSTICVPEDVSSITSAIRLAILKEIKTITLMPGEYRERIVIGGDLIEEIVSTLSEDSSGTGTASRSRRSSAGSSVLAAAGNLLLGRSSRSSVRPVSSSRAGKMIARGINLDIRAANPRQLTTLVSVTCADEGSNAASPVVSVALDPNYNVESEMLADEGAVVSVTLSNLSVVHSCLGTDIWTTNTAIRASGLVELDLQNCLVTSLSGRGIVMTGGASGELVDTTVYNCGATGLYVGDEETEVSLTRCNVINCGFGGRPASSAAAVLPVPTRGPTSDLLEIIESSLHVETLPVTVGNEGTVPSGHSGVYVEASNVVLDNTLVAASCLTGLTAVRGGGVTLSGCDFADNGSEAISTEDSFLAERAALNEVEEDMEGGVSQNGDSTKVWNADELRGDWASKLMRKGTI